MMCTVRAVFVTILLVVSGLPVASIADPLLPAPWREIHLPGPDYAWVNSRVAGHMITYVHHTAHRDMSFKGVSQVDMASGIGGLREVSLMQFGFSKWRLRTFDHDRSQDGDRIIMSGSYLTPEKVRVQFVEVQVFSGREYHQLSYMMKSESAIQPEFRKLLLQLLPRIQKQMESQRIPASATGETEAGGCFDCVTRAQGMGGPAELKLAGGRILDRAKGQDCSEKTFIFNPKRKSMLDSLGLDYGGTNPLIRASREAVSCVYGGLVGTGYWMKHLALLVPNILNLGWKGLKSAGTGIMSIDGAKLLETISQQNILDSSKRAFKTTAESTIKAIESSTAAIHQAYQHGGFTGSLAAMAQAAWDTSPHKVVGRWLADVTESIAGVLSKEWKGFQCSDPDVMVESICMAAAYIIEDLVTGRFILSALTNTAMITQAVNRARVLLERTPIAGEWMTKHLVAIDDKICENIPVGSWMVDAAAKLQGQELDVHVIDSKVYARGISPTSRKMGCFEVVGKMSNAIRDRVQSTQARASATTATAEATESATTTAAAEAADKIFVPASTQYARTTTDFVAAVNEKISVGISGKDVAKVAQTLEKNPEEMARYGEIARTLYEYKQVKMGSKGDPEKLAEANRVIAEAEATLKAVNQSLAAGGELQVNLSAVQKALDVALMQGTTRDLAVLRLALKELNAASKGTKEGSAAAIKAWEDRLRKTNPHVTEAEIAKARKCLISAVSR